MHQNLLVTCLLLVERMSGQVHFKFKSTKAFDSVSFDGHYVTVGELKTLIVGKKVPTLLHQLVVNAQPLTRTCVHIDRECPCCVRLPCPSALPCTGSRSFRVLRMQRSACTCCVLQGLGQEAIEELTLSDPRTGRNYDDDTAQIARNSSVVVKRTPGFKPHALQAGGSAALPQAAAPAAAEAAASANQPAGDAAAQPANGAAGDPAFGDLYSEHVVPEAVPAADDMQALLQQANDSWRQEMADSARAGYGRNRGGRFGGRGGDSGRFGPGGRGALLCMFRFACYMFQAQLQRWRWSAVPSYSSLARQKESSPVLPFCVITRLLEGQQVIG